MGATMWGTIGTWLQDTNVWSLVLGLVGVAVSVAGLRYSYLAQKHATGAEEAARAATQAANRRAAQDELTMITKAGDDLLRNLESPDWGRAADCGRQMLGLMGDFIGQHRGTELLDEAEFGAVEEHIAAIYRECVKLVRDPNSVTERKREKIHEKADNAVRRLVKLLGNTKRPHT